MGKKSRIKKERQQRRQPEQAATIEKTPLMDPKLIEAYTRGRNIGIEQGRYEGKVKGVAETFMVFNKWIEEIDQHVKGIGPKKKIEIEIYLGDRIKEAVNKNKINGVKAQSMRKHGQVSV